MSVVARARALVRRLVGVLPERLAVRLYPERYRYSVSDVPPPPPRLTESVRVLIGSTNYAAQGFRLARALERLDGVGARNVHQFPAGDTFRFPADIRVSGDVVRLSQHWRRRQFAAVAARYSHVIVESGRPMFGTLFELDAAREIDALRDRGVAVAHLAHGSDLRSPRIHRSFGDASPFLDGDWDAIGALQAGADAYAQLIDGTGAPVFVTTPDLLRDQPGGHWMPVIVDPERWEAPEPPLRRARPVVLHAPTNPRIKGTALIEPALTTLHDAGRIEYRPVSGVPAEQMPELVRSADIVLDQFRLGIYSVAAVEGLAAGRIVMADLHDDVVRAVRAATGRDVPLISVRARDIESAILGVLDDREGARAGAEAGPEFARGVHDGRLSADVVSRVFLAATRS